MLSQSNPSTVAANLLRDAEWRDRLQTQTLISVGLLNVITERFV